MIIDSHAHYNNNAYKKPCRYLSYGKDGYALKEGEWEQLFQELLDSNIPYSIEPGVSLQSCEEVLQLCSEYPARIFPAMGIHPTRSIYENWSDRKKLEQFGKLRSFLFLSGGLGCVYRDIPNFKFLVCSGDSFLYAIHAHHSFRYSPLFCCFF